MNTEMLKLNFSKICRTCMKETDQMKSIRTLSNVDTENDTFTQILNFCISAEANEEDGLLYYGLPNQICKNCCEELARFHKFKQLCEKSDETLRYYINLAASDINEEILIENDINEEILIENEELEIKIEEQSEGDIEKENNDESLRNDDECSDKEIKPKKRTTSKGPPFCCKRCETFFETAEELTQHREKVKHPRKRNKKCPICSKSFTFLTVHMRSHTLEKPFICEVCGQQFSRKCNLQRHLMIHTGEKPHRCDECGKGFIRSTSLQEHLRTHSGESPFTCSPCGKSFTRSEPLRTHLNQHSSENNYRPYTCDVCGKSFTRFGTLKTHALIHTGVKPCVCTICNKAFKQWNHLQHHLRTHSGERPYSCTVCCKKFSLKGNLTIHLRTHTGEKPFCCPICKKGFYDSSSMKKHQRRHTCSI